MSFEVGTDLRAYQAARFEDKRFKESQPGVYRDTAISDFIFNGIKQSSSSLILNKGIVVGDDTTDLPVAWRIIAPHHSQLHGIVKVEFGTGIPGYLNKDERRFDDELAIDKEIDHHGVSDAVRELFPRLGGDVLKLVRQDSTVFFSCIERIARKNLGENIITWNKLVYPNRLLATGKILEKYIDIQRSQGIRVPEWIYEASLGKNRRMTAASMAMSALYTYKIAE